MEARIVTLSLLLTTLAPLAVPTAEAATCTPPWSQWVVCVDLPCVIVDGPALHEVVCVPNACTPGVTQLQACLDWPCVIVDGPAFHREFCLSAVTA